MVAAAGRLWLASEVRKSSAHLTKRGSVKPTDVDEGGRTGARGVKIAAVTKSRKQDTRAKKEIKT